MTEKRSNSSEVSSADRSPMDESERQERLTHIVSQAALLFGDEQRARDWLYTPIDVLHDGTKIAPLKLAESEAGFRAVKNMIERTLHGLL